MSEMTIDSVPRLLESCEKYTEDVKDNFTKIADKHKWETVRSELIASASDDSKKLTRAEEKELQVELLGGVNFFSNFDRDEEEVQAFAQTIFRRVYDKVALDNPIPLFYNMNKQLDLDAKLEIHEAYGGRVYPWSYGAKRIASPLYQRSYEVLLNPWQLKFRVHEHELKTGRVLISEIVREAAQKILAHKVKIAMDALAAAYTDSGSYTINGGAVDLTLANVRTAQRAIRNLAEPRAIVGVNSALDPLYDISGYDVPSSGTGSGFPENVKEEIHRSGKMAMFRGTPVVGLMNYTDPLYGTTVYTAADVYVVPADEKKTFNIFNEYGSTGPEPVIRDADSKTIFIDFYWEDTAYIDTEKIKYGYRIRNNATS